MMQIERSGLDWTNSYPIRPEGPAGATIEGYLGLIWINTNSYLRSEKLR